MFELKNNSKIISRVDLRGCDPCHWDDEDRYQYIVKKDDKYGVYCFCGKQGDGKTYSLASLPFSIRVKISS